MTTAGAEPDKAEAYQRLFGYALGSQAVWIVDIGLKAGLFKALDQAGGDGLTESELAATLEFDRRYTGVWLRAAYAFELIDWRVADGRYRLAANMRALLLDGDDPQFIGGRMQFFAALYEDFKAFPSHLKTGAVWRRGLHDPWLLEALRNTTKPDPVMITEHVLPQIPDLLARIENGGTIVDLGAGAGYAISHYARRFPRARVIGLEYDQASVELMRRDLKAAGLDRRVEVVEGDANKLDHDRAFDLITLNITLHETGGPAEWRNVLARVRRALTPGGAAIVSELPYPDRVEDYRAAPVYKALAGVQIHEAIVGCGMITKSELAELMRAAGFARTRVADQPMATRLVMIGEK